MTFFEKTKFIWFGHMFIWPVFQKQGKKTCARGVTERLRGRQDRQAGGHPCCVSVFGMYFYSQNRQAWQAGKDISGAAFWRRQAKHRARPLTNLLYTFVFSIKENGKTRQQDRHGHATFHGT